MFWSTETSMGMLLGDRQETIYIQSSLGHIISVLAGYGKASVAYCGVLHHPQQRLRHGGHHRGYQQADPWGWAAGYQQLKYKLGVATGNHTREVDHFGPICSCNRSVEVTFGSGVLETGWDTVGGSDGGIWSVGERGRGGGRRYGWIRCHDTVAC